MITPAQVSNAIQLLKSSPDGSRANMQARSKARLVLGEHAKNLRTFASKKPGSKIAAICNLEAFNLERL